LGVRLFVDEVEALLLVAVATSATVATELTASSVDVGAESATVATELTASSVDVGAESETEEDVEACKVVEEEDVLIALSESEAGGLGW